MAVGHGDRHSARTRPGTRDHESPGDADDELESVATSSDDEVHWQVSASAPSKARTVEHGALWPPMPALSEG